MNMSITVTTFVELESIIVVTTLITSAAEDFTIMDAAITTHLMISKISIIRRKGKKRMIS